MSGRVEMRRTIAALSVVALGLAACSGGESEETTGAPSTSSADVTRVSLTVWAPHDDQLRGQSWLESMEVAFAQAHPEYAISWINEVVPPDEVGGTIVEDPEEAADVFIYANDQLGMLQETGAIGPLSDDSVNQLYTDFSEQMITSVTAADGQVYGMPTEPNTWFIYYNTAAFTTDQIKSLDTMLENGTVSLPISNAWYLASFYAGAGATFFGDGTDADAGIDLGERSANVTTYLLNLVNNPNFVNDTDGAGMRGLANGTIDAVFSGSWDANNAREALGQNYGVAALPSFTLDGEDIQLRAFSGSKAAGYNPNSEYAGVAEQFAAFLGTTGAQLAHYQMVGVIPANNQLGINPSISSDPVTLVIEDMVANSSISQPTLPEMSNFWGPASEFGLELINGDITADNAADKTDALQEAIND